MKSFIASVVAASAVTAVSQACLVTFDYSGSNANPSIFATATIDVTNAFAVTGSITVSGTGAMDGVYTLVSGTGNNGIFVWDSVFDMDSPTYMTTTGGLEFVNNLGNEINIWANSPTSFSLYGHLVGQGGFVPQDDGGMVSNVVPVPAPGAVALVGLAGLISGRRRNK